MAQMSLAPHINLMGMLNLILVFAQCPSLLKQENVYYVVEINNKIKEIMSCENGRSGNMLVTIKPGWVVTFYNQKYHKNLNNHNSKL